MRVMTENEAILQQRIDNLSEYIVKQAEYLQEYADAYNATRELNIVANKGEVPDEAYAMFVSKKDQNEAIVAAFGEKQEAWVAWLEENIGRIAGSIQAYDPLLQDQEKWTTRALDHMESVMDQLTIEY